MRVVLLSEFFCQGMGYLENMLPKYLARLGVETHVVATGLRPHGGQQPGSNSAQLGTFRPGSVEMLDGYTLHVVQHRKTLGYPRMKGLRDALKQIGPDIVQTMSVTGWVPLDAALYRAFLGYKLFTGCHYHASVFPLARKATHPLSAERAMCTLTRGIPGRLLSRLAEKCYAISPDCADVAVRFFGVPAKCIEICPLGVDTEIFHPISSSVEQSTREHVRAQLGFRANDIVCIYSGRFSEDKNPLLLAKAIDALARCGGGIRGLFIGNGIQAHEIRECANCVVHPFVTVSELGDFYRAAEIGVWPRQESMSMLDAAACGLPIVVNHTLAAPERIDGNGMVYRLDDMNDLIRVLTSLMDTARRRGMGKVGSSKMAGAFSWEAIAKRRLQDYESALCSN